MAHGQDQLLAGDRPGRSLDAGQRAAAQLQAGQRGLKADLAAQGLDLAADAADDAAQKVGADMRFLPPGDLSRGAVAQKRLRHKGAQRVAHAGGKLAVGKRTRAALAKLDVGILVQDAGRLKAGDGLDAAVQRGAAFQHQRAVPGPGQQQRGKQPRRAQAHHDRPVRERRRPLREGKLRRLRETDTGRGPGQRRFLTLVFECDGYGIHQHRLAVAGVYREFGHPAARRPAGRDAQDAQRLRPCLGVRVGAGKRQADIAD